MFQILAGLLSFFYGIVPNYGVAIALLTLTVMLVLSPLTLKSTRSMLAMQKLQPELKRLQQEHKGDRQKLNEAMMGLYKEHGVNPVAGCLPMLLQAPVLLVMFQVIRGLTRSGEDGTFDPKYLDVDSALYRALDGARSMKAFGVDLARSATDSHSSFLVALPFFLIVVLVVATQYYQSRQTMARNKSAVVNPQQQLLMNVLPVIFGVFSISIPAGVNVYLLVSALFRVSQTAAMYRFDPKLAAHTRTHAAELEAKVTKDPKGGKANGGRASGNKVPRGGAKPTGKPPVSKTVPKSPGPAGAAKTNGAGTPRGPKGASRPPSGRQHSPKRRAKKGR